MRVDDRINKDPACTKLYAFDPQSEEIVRLSDCPTAQYASHLAYHPRHDVFVMACAMKYGDAPSGTYCYDPKVDAWRE